MFVETDTVNLNTENGMKKLIEHLDKWYRKDELTGVYEAWTKFDSYRKEKTDSMEKYILEFEKRSRALNKYKEAARLCRTCYYHSIVTYSSCRLSL